MPLRNTHGLFIKTVAQNYDPLDDVFEFDDSDLDLLALREQIAHGRALELHPNGWQETEQRPCVWDQLWLRQRAAQERQRQERAKQLDEQRRLEHEREQRERAELMRSREAWEDEHRDEVPPRYVPIDSIPASSLPPTSNEPDWCWTKPKPGTGHVFNDCVFLPARDFHYLRGDWMELERRGDMIKVKRGKVGGYSAP